MNLPEEYRIVQAVPRDSDIVAAQRGQMFVDMGTMSQAEALENQAVWAEWLQEVMVSGEYLGFLVTYVNAEYATEAPISEIVGGVGILFQTKFPTHKDPGTVKALILNMSVNPEHRRKGLAEALMQAALTELRARGIRNVSLNAAPMGKRIYERLGFIEAYNPEMRLTLEEP